ncbi:ABC transporter permease [Paroceanicella profunda]|uniref:ABC transporter permease n=1 Tax=Paroceanicella profunda TaxID=2579971 RepID=UPI001EEF876C|nr:hypothetical protein [Paroceanicella profunda]
MARIARPDWASLGLLAFVVVFFVFMLAPILVVVVVSFTSASYVAFPVPGWSLKWFWHIFEYEPFIASLIVSFEVAVGATVLSCLIGIPACLALARSRAGWAGAVMTFLLSPLSMPMIVIASRAVLPVLGGDRHLLHRAARHPHGGVPAYVVRTVAGVPLRAARL